MPIILGIDPGSRITGYGVIQAQGKQVKYLASGCVHLEKGDLGRRLQQLFLGLQQVIQQYNPNEIAVEQVFLHQNPNVALKLGQARGVAIVAATLHSMTLHEYAAREVKLAVVGYGAAKKEQVQHMVRMLLNLPRMPSVDAADALAVALCHAHSRTLKQAVTEQT